MPNPVPVDLDALDEFLMSDKAPDESMGLSDLDGFLTGIVVGPELIMPGEWLPVIWGGGNPEFEDAEEAGKILGTIMERYNEIIGHLDDDPRNFDPIFWEGRDGAVIVADWAAGFLDAVKLRPKAWEPLIKHPDARMLMMPLLVLGADGDEVKPFGDRQLPADEVEKLAAEGDEIIPECVIGIQAFWKEHRTQPVGNRHERRASREPRR